VCVCVYIVNIFAIPELPATTFFGDLRLRVTTSDEIGTINQLVLTGQALDLGSGWLLWLTA